MRLSESVAVWEGEWGMGRGKCLGCPFSECSEGTRKEVGDSFENDGSGGKMKMRTGEEIETYILTLGVKSTAS